MDMCASVCVCVRVGDAIAFIIHTNTHTHNQSGARHVAKLCGASSSLTSPSLPSLLSAGVLVVRVLGLVDDLILYTHIHLRPEGVDTLRLGGTWSGRNWHAISRCAKTNTRQRTHAETNTRSHGPTSGPIYTQLVMCVCECARFE